MKTKRVLFIGGSLDRKIQTVPDELSRINIPVYEHPSGGAISISPDIETYVLESYPGDIEFFRFDKLPIGDCWKLLIKNYPTEIESRTPPRFDYLEQSIRATIDEIQAFLDSIQLTSGPYFADETVKSKVRNLEHDLTLAVDKIYEPQK
jgi:hypothetical protein